MPQRLSAPIEPDLEKLDGVVLLPPRLQTLDCRIQTSAHREGGEGGEQGTRPSLKYSGASLKAVVRGGGLGGGSLFLSCVYVGGRGGTSDKVRKKRRMGGEGGQCRPQSLAYRRRRLASSCPGPFLPVAAGEISANTTCQLEHIRERKQGSITPPMRQGPISPCLCQLSLKLMSVWSPPARTGTYGHSSLNRWVASKSISTTTRDTAIRPRPLPKTLGVNN